MELVLGDRTAAAVVDELPVAGAPHAARAYLGNMLAACGSSYRGRLRVSVDEVTPVAATATITCVVASMTAGDTLLIGDSILTCVAGAATAASGQYSKDTSNTACGISLKAAIKALPGVRELVTATESSGTVTITARTLGTIGNSLKLRKKVTTGAAHILSGATLSGGKDESARASGVITCVHANTDANDTIQIGSTVMTVKASGATGDDEFNIGTTDTTLAANLVTCINAHPELEGICTATNAVGVVTVAFQCDARLAQHIVFQTSDADGLALTTQPTTTITITNSLAPREYDLGAP